MENLRVSLVFIALCASGLFFLTTWIGPIRGKLGVLRGDGGDDRLFKAIRIHGNFIENAPLFALLLAAAELLGLSSGWLWAAVGSFFAGRAYHFVRYDRMDRGVGMAMTTMPTVPLGIFVVYRVLAGG